MPNLTDVYNALQQVDEPLIKQAEEMQKLAEEEDAAGRIMARGFADELNKLAGIMDPAPQLNIDPQAMAEKARRTAAGGGGIPGRPAKPKPGLAPPSMPAPVRMPGQ